MKFNVNHVVRVRLTDAGRAWHRTQHAIFAAEYCNQVGKPAPMPYQAPVESEDGSSIWQLWALMAMFGGACLVGGPPPFDMEIDILDDREQRTI